MTTRRLGKNGPEISAIGYGAMSFSDFYGATSEAESHAILDHCRDVGLTHLDTSNIYGMGRSEEVIGSYFAAHPDAKQEFVIATKASIARDESGNRIFRNDRKHLEEELDKSLQRMGVDHVGLFYVHRRDPNVPIEEVTESLAAIVKTGKALGFGYSEIAPSSLRRAAKVAHVSAVQSEYSLSTRSPELGLVQACAELGTALVAFSPVGRSLLTDTPLSFEAVQSLDFLRGNPRFMRPNYEANVRAAASFCALAAEMGVSAAGLANAWLLAQGDNVIPIPGTRSVSHLSDCLQGRDLVLTGEDLARIEMVLPLGWAHGDRYSDAQWIGPERYC